MNMNDLMKIGAGVVLVGSVCESAMCYDYVAGKMLRSGKLYDLAMEKQGGGLTETFKTAVGNWGNCGVIGGVEEIVKGIYAGGAWNTLDFDSKLSDEAKILMIGIAKNVKDAEAQTDKEGWQLMRHMFRDNALLNKWDNVADVLNAWGQIAREEAVAWKMYEKLAPQEKAKLERKVGGYAASSWACCGVNDKLIEKWLAKVDSLCEEDLSDDKDDLYETSLRFVIRNGKKIKGAQTKGKVAIWSGNKLNKDALAEWKNEKKDKGAERQKLIADALIVAMGSGVGEEVSSGLEVINSLVGWAPEVAAGADPEELTKAQKELQGVKKELQEAQKELREVSDKSTAALDAASQMGLDFDPWAGTIEVQDVEMLKAAIAKSQKQ